jgi:hypothetical protein
MGWTREDGLGVEKVDLALSEGFLSFRWVESNPRTASELCSYDNIAVKPAREPGAERAHGATDLRITATENSGQPSASSSSMKPETTDSPFDQKDGSAASSPNGASNSRWRKVPPARSISR